VLHVPALLGLYSLYLLYSGIPILMRVPAERALAFTGTLIAVGLIVGIVVAALIGAVVPLPGPTDMDMGKVGGKISLPGGVNLDMDKLDKAAKQLEQMSKQAAQPADEGAGEAGENSGPPSAISPGDLKALLPASLPSGFARTDISTASGGAAGFDFGSAKAIYAKGDARGSPYPRPIRVRWEPLAALGSALGANAARRPLRPIPSWVRSTAA
jgi:hypothetical protein